MLRVFKPSAAPRWPATRPSITLLDTFQCQHKLKSPRDDQCDFILLSISTGENCTSSRLQEPRAESCLENLQMRAASNKHNAWQLLSLMVTFTGPRKCEVAEPLEGHDNDTTCAPPQKLLADVRSRSTRNLWFVSPVTIATSHQTHQPVQAEPTLDQLPSFVVILQFPQLVIDFAF